MMSEMQDSEIYALVASIAGELPAHPDQSVREHVRVNRVLGLSAERRDITCRRCGNTEACVRWTTRAGLVADTWGYMEFGEPDGNVCTDCLGESYMGELLARPS